jgi:hypothetical protein
MKNTDVVSNNYCMEITLEEARTYLKMGKTIEVRIYDKKNRIKYWEKYNAVCNNRECWSLEEIINGRFFLIIDEGI